MSETLLSEQVPLKYGLFDGFQIDENAPAHADIHRIITPFMQSPELRITPYAFVGNAVAIADYATGLEVLDPKLNITKGAYDTYKQDCYKTLLPTQSRLWYDSLGRAMSDSKTFSAVTDSTADFFTEQLQSDISKEVALECLEELRQFSKATTQQENTNYGLVAGQIYLQLLLSGKNSLGNQISQKLSGLLTEADRRFNTSALLAAKLHALINSSDPLIHHQFQAIKREQPRAYKDAKALLPVYSTLSLLSTCCKSVNARQGRKAAIEIAAAITQPEIVRSAFPDYTPPAPKPPTLEERLTLLGPELLDFKVLRPGELQDESRHIVDDIRNRRAGQSITIDLQRIQQLQDIQEYWGSDRSYFARGKYTTERTVAYKGQSFPDEYVVLVLQELDNAGNVTQEHAVADSPIVGLHAMYVYRQDAGDGIEWQSVLSLDKRNARLFNARQVYHTAQGLSVTEKAKQQLEMNKDAFTRTRRYKPRGFKLPNSVVELDVQPT